MASIRTMVLTSLVAGMTATAAHSAVLIDENFESIALGPYVSATEVGKGDGTDWSATLPAGWTSSFTGPAGNPVEFQGWKIHDVDSWIATEGDQERSFWSRGGVGSHGKVLVADTDAYDDGTNIDIGLFNAFVSTPAINLGTLAPASVVISFDSFLKVEATSILTLAVTFDGGTSYTTLLTYDPALLADGLVIDDRVSIAVANPGSGSMSFRFALTNGSNDWWWGIDDVLVTADLAGGGAAVSAPSTLALAALGLGALALRRRRG